MAGCFHCGLTIALPELIHFDEKVFCCNGCKTVYSIFKQNNLNSYYDFANTPGTTPVDNQGKFDFLDNEDIAARLLVFHEKDMQIASLHIPFIHCSSCIWILENLNKLHPGINSSEVNFPTKKLRITFDSAKTNLKQIVLMLCSIGYEPNISLNDYSAETSSVDRSLTYKLGVAFFCFGNIMLLSFPEYFEVKEFWLDQYRNFFRWLIFLLALPTFFYSASGYYIAAYKSLRTGMLNIEIPIALGIIVMFVRSVFDMLLDHGPGFFDSLSGLVFFMLLGKMFQQKTYSFLNFERDYKSYFPVAVTRLSDNQEAIVPVYDIEKGDRLLIRNQEIIPVDGILISADAAIDYSFVTGEAVPVSKVSGDRIFAGGKLTGQIAEVEALKPVSQSYLTQLWGNAIFQKEAKPQHQNITDKVSRYFTPALLLIAVLGFSYWIFFDVDTAFNVFTAVLIVACPCALALTVPFTMGNVLRILGREKFYLKNATVVEQLAQVDTIVFDKTGTITSNNHVKIDWEGASLHENESNQIKNLLRASNHPLSRLLYSHLPGSLQIPVSDYTEKVGLGISGNIASTPIIAGAAAHAGATSDTLQERTSIHININGTYRGRFTFKQEYRTGLKRLFRKLHGHYSLKVLSGDNDGEREKLEEMLPPETELVFNRTPDQKLDFVKELQQNGHNVLMVGDGLNDAGALMQSNVGISISENINVFSPACDAILDASKFGKISRFLVFCKSALTTIKWSFALSLLYNVVGLAFAVTGNLLPLVAAIIMPLSTITIISFVTIRTNLSARKIHWKQQQITNT